MRLRSICPALGSRDRDRGSKRSTAPVAFDYRSSLWLCPDHHRRGFSVFPPTARWGLNLEICFDVVLGAQQPRFECREERIVAELHQHRSAAGLFDDCRGSSWYQTFLRNPVEVSAASLHIRAGLLDTLPRHFKEHRSSSRVYRLGRDFFTWSWHTIFSFGSFPLS